MSIGEVRVQSAGNPVSLAIAGPTKQVSFLLNPAPSAPVIVAFSFPNDKGNTIDDGAATAAVHSTTHSDGCTRHNEPLPITALHKRLSLTLVRWMMVE